jgi:hypothetical protein
MADVFISFIHEEVYAAQSVQRVLKQLLTPDVFISADDWAVLAGEIWLDRITQELEGSKVVVLMLSALSVTRPWINFEAGGAWLAKKPIIPACFGGLGREKLPKPYSAIQALDLPGDLYYLVRSVAKHLKTMSPPPFHFRSYAQRSVEAGIKGEVSIILPPNASWTDEMDDDDFHSFKPDEQPAP